MLPYTPLHYLLMEGGFEALVMTSGNISEEPINIENQTAYDNLRGIADYFLIHNRDIYLRSDDSIIRVVDDVPRQIRRSRGYVPIPVFLPDHMSGMPSVLALGGELKNTICLTKENRAFLSQHVGDMENLETYDFFSLTVSHLKRILEIEPNLIAHDLHPDYLSSKYAREQDDYPTLAVQHHHAHIVSCLAENGVRGPVIGLAMDGTGYGSDGQIWGGEVLLTDLSSFKRAAHLEYVVLPGGDTAAKFPWRMGLSYLHKIYGKDLFSQTIDFVRNIPADESSVVLQMIEKRINSLNTSSLGRLFDAVSALIGLRQKIAYEGQAAIELEMRQTMREKGSYDWSMRDQDGSVILETYGIIQGVVEDLKKGLSRGRISRRFHNTLIDMFTGICLRFREETGIDLVAMSGGAFQNATLLTGLTHKLEENGFKAFTHSMVPTNDGCISLGQAVCAGMRSMGVEGAFGEG